MPDAPRRASPRPDLDGIRARHERGIALTVVGTREVGELVDFAAHQVEDIAALLGEIDRLRDELGDSLAGNPAKWRFTLAELNETTEKAVAAALSRRDAHPEETPSHE